MTKKDFDLIAACLGGAQADQKNDTRTVEDINRRLILELSLENPRFNEAIFRDRVGYWRSMHSENG